MRKLVGLYYKLKNIRKEKYITHKFGNCDCPVYDSKYKEWHYRYREDDEDEGFLESGDIKNIFFDFAKSGLIYCYTHKNADPEYGSHAHDFDSVLWNAYRYPFSFKIEDQYKEQYSKQELDLIDKVIENRIAYLRKNRNK